jgi:DNA invertase Pin-like site-specific DNA recombinase
MAEPIICYSYSRVSSLSQRDTGTGISRQEDDAVTYAQDMGFILDSKVRFRDDGKSASDGSNLKGALGKFVALVATGTLPDQTPLLVEAIDRLSRALAGDAMELILGILRAGVEIHTIEDGEIYSRKSINEQGRLSKLAGMIEAAAKFSQRLSGRVISGRARNRAEKLAKGAALSSMCPAWLRRSGDKYEEISDRVVVLKTIFKLLAEGRGCQSIATELNRTGTPVFDRAGQGMTVTTQRRVVGGWYASYIDKLRQNIAVMGDYQPTKKRVVDKKETIKNGEIVRGHFPEIIPRDVFAKVSAVKAPAGRRGVNYVNLLTGLAFCAYCNSPMVIVDKGVRWPNTKRPRVLNQPTVFLQCGASRRDTVCTHNSLIPYKPLEKHLIGLATQFMQFDRPRAPAVNVHDAALTDAHTERQMIKDGMKRHALYGGSDSLSKELAGDLQRDAAKIDAKILKLEKLKAKTTEAIAPVAWNALIMMWAEAQASKDAKERYRLREKIAGFLRRVVDKIRADPDTGCYDTWLRQGFIYTQLEKGGMATTLLINGKKCIMLLEHERETLPIEMKTPAPILEQHLALMNGGEPTKEAA